MHPNLYVTHLNMMKFDRFKGNIGGMCPLTTCPYPPTKGLQDQDTLIELPSDLIETTQSVIYVQNFLSLLNILCCNANSYTE